MSEVGLVEKKQLELGQTLKQQFDAIDQEIIKDIADKCYDSYFKAQIGMWLKGRAIEQNRKNHLPPSSYYQLEKETGRGHVDIARWYKIYINCQDEEKYQEKAKQIAEHQTLKRLAGIEALTAKEADEEIIPLPEGKYQVIYVDIPWQYDVDLSKGATRSPENNYPVMDLDTIKKFGDRVKEISHTNCILFMWITAPKLNWMNDVLEAFNFEYKTNLIWDKIKPNMGHYSSVRHEILIIAGKGKCAPICSGVDIQSIDSVQSIEKSARHSEKPIEFMDIIDKLYPNYKKIELFARNKEVRKNWTYWGNEANICKT